jgi:hypothetical protein
LEHGVSKKSGSASKVDDAKSGSNVGEHAVLSAIEGLPGKSVAFFLALLGFGITAITTKAPVILLALAIAILAWLAICVWIWSKSSRPRMSRRRVAISLVPIVLISASLAGYVYTSHQQSDSEHQQALKPFCSKLADVNAALYIGLRYSDAHPDTLSLKHDLFVSLTQKLNALTTAADATQDARFSTAARKLEADITSTSDIFPPNPRYFTSILAVNMDVLDLNKFCASNHLPAGAINPHDDQLPIIETNATVPEICEHLRTMTELAAKQPKIHSATGKRLTGVVLSVLVETGRAKDAFRVSAFTFVTQGLESNLVFHKRMSYPTLDLMVACAKVDRDVFPESALERDTLKHIEILHEVNP